MLRVQIADRQALLQADRALLRRLARRAAPVEWSPGALSLTIVGEEEMIALNRRFTGREGDTDVLAFGFSAEEPHPGTPTFGEVIVCASRAKREANRRRVDPLHELALYVVHGVLHLSGYDDHSTPDRARMYRREAETLQACGVPCVRRARCSRDQRVP